MDQMSIVHDVRAAIKELGVPQQYLAKKTGVSQSAISRLINDQGAIKSDALAKIVDFLGGKLSFPGQDGTTVKDVCFVDAQASRPDESSPRIPTEKYMAVPLAQGSVAAGPGLIPEDGIRGWVLAMKEQSSVRYRKNLVAVEIGKGQESMVPTLHPLDIVLIDRDDFRPEPEGSIFLIREPGPDADVAIKRVYTQRRDGEVLLQFVSDNPDKKSFPPAVWSLERDYGGDLRRAIVGRVVWSWSDMTKK